MMRTMQSEFSGNGLDHERDILRLEAELDGCLLHHIAKKALRLLCSVCEFADLQLSVGQVCPGQGTADLMVVYFLNFHMNHILNIKDIEMSSPA